VFTVARDQWTSRLRVHSSLTRSVDRTLDQYPSSRHETCNFTKLMLVYNSLSRFQWPRGLKRRSAVAGVAGSNSAPGVDVCLLCLYVVSCIGRGLCDGLITRPEESYRVS
jgi:hypothetical protein